MGEIVADTNPGCTGLWCGHLVYSLPILSLFASSTIPMDHGSFLVIRMDPWPTLNTGRQKVCELPPFKYVLLGSGAGERCLVSDQN